MERPVNLTRRDFLKAAAIIPAGLFLGGCEIQQGEPYSPAKYTLNFPAGADRVKKAQSELEGVTASAIALRETKGLFPRADTWRLGSAELSLLGGNTYSLTLLPEQPLPALNPENTWRGMLVNSYGEEVEIGRIKQGPASQTIKDSNIIPFENRNWESLRIDFSLPRAALPSLSQGWLALMQYQPDGRPVRETGQLFNITAASR